ncbi:MAG: HNH endonuclease [Alphaproteobacteria bacterium]
MIYYRDIPSRVREAILTVYDHKCQYCLGMRESNASHIDHIIPLSKPYILSEWKIELPNNNLSSLENLIAACETCNLQKKDKVLPIGITGILLSRAQENKARIIEILHDNGFVYGGSDNTLVVEATSKLRKFLSKNSKAIGNINHKKVEEYLRCGANIHACTSAILYWAAFRKNTEIVTQLLEKNTYERSYNKCFRDCVLNKNYTIATILIPFVDKNTIEKTLYSTLCNNVLITSEIFMDLANVNQLCNEGTFIKELVSAGGDVTRIKKERLRRLLTSFIDVVEFDEELQEVIGSSSNLKLTSSEWLERCLTREYSNQGYCLAGIILYDAFKLMSDKYTNIHYNNLHRCIYEIGFKYKHTKNYSNKVFCSAMKKLLFGFGLNDDVYLYNSASDATVHPKYIFEGLELNLKKLEKEKEQLNIKYNIASGFMQSQ